MILAVLLCCVASVVADPKNDSRQRRTKARYYFLKGSQRHAEGKDDEAYEFFKKAHLTDPDYSDAAYMYGLLRTVLIEDTFASINEFRRDLSLMKPLLDEYPADINSAERYAYAASFSDTVPESIRVYNILIKESPGLSRLYLPLSVYYNNMHNVDSAVWAIRQFERLEGMSTETTIRKVTAWLSIPDTLAALAEARYYAEANPSNPDASVDKAMIYNLLGQQDSAIIILEDVLKRFPDRSETKFDIAMLYAERGDSLRFHKLVDEAFRGEDLEYEDRMGMLTVYTKKLPFGAADYAESDRLYEYAGTLYADDPDFYDQYATYEMTKKDYAEAAKKEMKAMELNPNEPFFLVRFITFSVLAGKPEEGMKAFEDFQNEDVKKDYNIVMAFVGAAHEARDYQAAIKAVDNLFGDVWPTLSLWNAVSPEVKDSLENAGELMTVYNAASVYEVAGDIFARMGRSEDAVRSYENAIFLVDSTDASALNNYAYYIVETLKAVPGSDEFEKAKTMSRKSLDQTESNPQGNNLDTYAWILFKEKDFKGALNYIETAIEIMEKAGEEPASEIFSHYGDILFKNNRQEEALEQWEKALKLDSDDALLRKKVENKTYFEE